VPLLPGSRGGIYRPFDVLASCLVNAGELAAMFVWSLDLQGITGERLPTRNDQRDFEALVCQIG
jgi:hypothetical protein